MGNESVSSNAVGIDVLDLSEAMAGLQKCQIKSRSFYWPLGGLGYFLGYMGPCQYHG